MLKLETAIVKVAQSFEDGQWCFCRDVHYHLVNAGMLTIQPKAESKCKVIYPNSNQKLRTTF